MSSEFEHLGWFKEYFVNKRFIGTQMCEKDREVIGYNGMRRETTTERLILGNQTIKEGTEVQTILYPLCGKKIKE